jgi:hypothetical protein
MLNNKNFDIVFLFCVLFWITIINHIPMQI